MLCDELVRGSIYSAKGGNRYDDCPNPVKYRVWEHWHDGGGWRYVCGIHARKYLLFNKRHIETGRILHQEREPFYRIEVLDG